MDKVVKGMGPVLKVGYNPNLCEDVKSILQLECTLDEIQQILNELDTKSANTYEKLVAFIDRMEFVSHLDCIKNQARQNKFIFDGKEVNGIDNDIDALRLYLTLSCIDMFASIRLYKTFDEWLLSNCDDFSSKEAIKAYIKRKSNEYNEIYGVSSNFKSAFINADSNIKERLVKNLSILDKNGKNLGSENLLDSIIQFLKNVRNKYTHEGKRVYYSATSAVSPSAVAIGVRLKEVNGEKMVENRSNTLIISAGFDLISVLKELAIEQCKRAIKFQV